VCEYWSLLKYEVMICDGRGGPKVSHEERELMEQTLTGVRAQGLSMRRVHGVLSTR